MKTAQQWYDEYAVSHQNETNQKIHYICVPAIFFSIVGMIMSIPAGFIQNNLGISNPIIGNWASLVMVLLLLFYLRLSFTLFIRMLGFGALCLIGNYYLGQTLPLFLTSLGIFILAWIGQFYGHHIEGKKTLIHKRFAISLNRTCLGAGKTFQIMELNNISFEDFQKVDLRVGTIVEVNDFPEARIPAFKLTIDFGDLGVKKSSAQITSLYSKDSLIRKKIIAVVNFKAKQIANFKSECLVLGIQNGSDVVLLNPNEGVANGTQVL